jgi:hypothetical protein
MTRSAEQAMMQEINAISGFHDTYVQSRSPLGIVRYLSAHDHGANQRAFACCWSSSAAPTPIIQPSVSSMPFETWSVDFDCRRS